MSKHASDAPASAAEHGRCLDADTAARYVEGDRGTDEANEVAAHIERCGECRARHARLGA